jgi:hypothetical protein
MEIKNPGKVFIVDQTCRVCKTGRMRPTGEVVDSSPPYYYHKCNSITCGYKESYTQLYPFQTFEEIST